MFDHDKLSPGPWTYEGSLWSSNASVFDFEWIENCEPARYPRERRNADGGLMADARNALAIQMETGWHAERSLDDLSAWFVVQTFVEMSQLGHDEIYHPTPVHAILAAWEWWKKREGK